MQNLPLKREQLLGIALGVIVVGALVRGPVYNWIAAPFQERSEQIARLEKETSQLNDEEFLILKAQAQLADWRKSSLPPDRGAATIKKPEALDAQRLYAKWVTDLLVLSGFETPTVKPGGKRETFVIGTGQSAKTVALGVKINIETEGRFSQLCTFLDHYYRANLLQEITKLEIVNRDGPTGDPILKIDLETMGLALTDVPWRKTIYPETALTAEINDKAKTLAVKASDAFPKKVPFRIRIGNEYLTVTAIAGQDWTIERGADRTYAATHKAGDVVELAPVKSHVPSRSPEEFRELLAANIFIKPPPPKEYKLQLGPLTEQAFARGDSLSYTIPVKEYDPTLGKPEFVVKNDPPPGLILDRGIGKITWTPKADQPIGEFPLELEVRHPSATKGVETGTLKIVFREPNSVPTVETPKPQMAYIGRAWTFPLTFQDAETPADQLELKLDNPPEGVALNATKRELTWTPPATTKPGDVTINVTATDKGTPPQSKALAVPVKVEDDAASFTYLVGAVSVDGAWQAWLYNRARDQQTVIRVGDQVNISDVKGTVSEIGKDFVILKQGEAVHRLELGQNLRELATATATTEATPAKS
ncbi:hypothetical protein GC163_12095 [bacterium]|nr:hypothetical protein [bacterium]